MGYKLKEREFNQLLGELSEKYLIYAPKVFVGKGRFSDTDCIRYDKVKNVEDMELSLKSQYSFKEVLNPVSETLFYFTEDSVKEADMPRNKGAIIFLRSCDLHAVERMDEMYLNNGPKDYYYKRLRDNIHFVLIGCSKAFDSCFCVDMGTNKSDNYDIGLNVREDGYELDVKWDEAKDILGKMAKENSLKEEDVTVDFVKETTTRVSIPKNLSYDVSKSKIWEEYAGRCINCGRCNFVCPTCTCFTMQDVYYDANGKVGERRRVWASCMVDGYTDVAGGGSYRKNNGERMRFKTLHKALDYRNRTGYNMCVGCGRCDDICPEYISFSNILNKLDTAMKEVSAND